MGSGDGYSDIASASAVPHLTRKLTGVAGSKASAAVASAVSTFTTTVTPPHHRPPRHQLSHRLHVNGAQPGLKCSSARKHLSFWSPAAIGSPAAQCCARRLASWPLHQQFWVQRPPPMCGSAVLGGLPPLLGVIDRAPFRPPSVIRQFWVYEFVILRSPMSHSPGSSMQSSFQFCSERCFAQFLDPLILFALQFLFVPPCAGTKW